MIVQILDAQPHGLARTRASDRQRIGQQPELVIEPVGGGDEFAHLVVGEDDVARFLRIRQTGKSDFPSIPVLNALVVLRRLFQCGAQATAEPVDRGRRHRAQQAVAPFLQLGGREQCHRLRQQRAGEMQARPFGVVGIGAARLQIGPVVRQRAIDGDRCVVGAAVLAARQLLRLSPAPDRTSARLAVGILEIVGLAQRPLVQYAPWPSLTFSTHVPLVLLRRYISAMPRASDGPLIGPAPDGELASVRCGFPVR